MQNITGLQNEQNLYIRHLMNLVDLAFETGNWDALLPHFVKVSGNIDNNFRDKVTEKVLARFVEQLSACVYNNALFWDNLFTNYENILVSDLIHQADAQRSEIHNVAKLTRRQIESIPRVICTKIATMLDEDFTILGLETNLDPQSQQQAYLVTAIRNIKQFEQMSEWLNTIDYQDYNKVISVQHLEKILKAGVQYPYAFQERMDALLEELLEEYDVPDPEEEPGNK